MIPDQVDCVVVGTGLTASILAAACSRIGKSVLHVDKNNYYGVQWASFTFQQLIEWISTNQPGDPSLESIPEELMSKSRMFCLDLCPRLLYSYGAMVELLVKSNVSRYHEFKNNIRVLSMVDDTIHVIPSRRSDVFTSPLLSDLVDKRRLMQFIEMCTSAKQDESSAIVQNASMPIAEFLHHKGLKPILRDFIINSIAMVDPSTTTAEACDRIRYFMAATERYGRSPFLCPLYGCGDFPQSFCRLSAVFGGIYCLNTQILSVEVKSASLSNESNTDLATTESANLENVTHQTGGPKENIFVVKFQDEEKQIRSDFLIVDPETAMSLKLAKQSSPSEQVSRAILITNQSIVPDNSENMNSFLRIPATGNKHVVHVMEFNSSVMVCPPSMNIVYLWTKASNDGSGSSAEADLGPTVERLYNVGSNRNEDGDEKENPVATDDNSSSIGTTILWKYYYRQSACGEQGDCFESNFQNLHITNPPRQLPYIDYDTTIEEAKRIFDQICPDQEFLPRAPDPDEIIS